MVLTLFIKALIGERKASISTFHDKANRFERARRKAIGPKFILNMVARRRKESFTFLSQFESGQTYCEVGTQN